MYTTIIEKANKFVHSCSEAAMGVIDEQGFPSVSTVSSLCSNDIKTLHFATALETNKVKRLQKDNRSSVCYADGTNNVTLVGTVKILTHQEAKNEYWEDWFMKHFPGGKIDPTYCILEFTTLRASLWIDYKTAEFPIDEAIC